MKVLAIGGGPGTGKTTLMKSFMGHNGWKYCDSTKYVPFHNLGDSLILGRYEPGVIFGGTDRMSMAAQPEVQRFIGGLVFDSSPLGQTKNVIFEGDRLFNSSFLEFCLVSGFDLGIMILNEPQPMEIVRRYQERNSNQDPAWVAGRVSKVENIKNNSKLRPYISCHDHNTPDDTENIVSAMKTFLADPYPYKKYEPEGVLDI